MPSFVPWTLYIISFLSTINQRIRYYYSTHFTDGQNETLEDSVIFAQGIQLASGQVVIGTQIAWCQGLGAHPPCRIGNNMI